MEYRLLGSLVKERLDMELFSQAKALEMAFPLLRLTISSVDWNQSMIWIQPVVKLVKSIREQFCAVAN